MLISLLVGLLVVLVVYRAVWYIGLTGLGANRITIAIIVMIGLLVLLCYVGYGSSLHL